MPLSSMTAGIPKMTMKAITSIDHTSSGKRSRDRPGARNLNVVTTISMAPTRAAISVNVIICAHMSTRLPGENWGPDSGT